MFGLFLSMLWFVVPGRCGETLWFGKRGMLGICCIVPGRGSQHSKRSSERAWHRFPMVNTRLVWFSSMNLHFPKPDPSPNSSRQALREPAVVLIERGDNVLTPG
jgi:hypothetical protein